MPEKMNIAILGSRGIPNQYGGFEECAEKLSLRLVQKGHAVTVYTVDHHQMKDKNWNGVRRVLIKDYEKSIGTAGHFLYDLNCNLHSRKQDFDIILHLGYTSDSVWQWLWSGKAIHIVNMDGLEWQRSKYSASVRSFLKFGEKLATRNSSFLIADSPVIQEYLEKHYDRPVVQIAYGADLLKKPDQKIIQEMGLAPWKYDILIARFIHDNNIEMVIRAKLAAKDDVPLVLVGNMNNYRRELETKYRNEVLLKFWKPVYQKDILGNMRHFSRLHIHGHSAGGTNPSLLEAMACGSSIAAHDNPFNRAVCGEDAYYFSTTEELSDVFFTHQVGSCDEWIKNNRQKITHQYNWNLITDAYEQLFYEAINSR
jgi:glycosyltransferase involved in cell wall biosynthesis